VAGAQAAAINASKMLATSRHKRGDGELSDMVQNLSVIESQR
jgi:hypothetical protein